MSYEEALKKTDIMKLKTVAKDSAEEKAAIERFKDFFAVFTEENVSAKVRGVYAENAYLNDTLKEVDGIDAIEAYFLESTRALESCTVEFPDVAVSGNNYYFRWIMDIKFKKLKKGRICRSYGISHIRFDETGKVVLHQDYWDSANGLFEHIPVLGGLIKIIKGRL